MLDCAGGFLGCCPGCLWPAVATVACGVDGTLGLLQPVVQDCVVNILHSYRVRDFAKQVLVLLLRLLVGPVRVGTSCHACLARGSEVDRGSRVAVVLIDHAERAGVASRLVDIEVAIGLAARWRHDCRVLKHLSRGARDGMLHQSLTGQLVGVVTLHLLSRWRLEVVHLVGLGSPLDSLVQRRHQVPARARRIIPRSWDTVIVHAGPGSRLV